jgi:hypothetical protein
VKRLLTALTLGLCLGVAGCGKDDKNLNKDLKPIEPGTPPPKPANESQGGKGPADGPSGVVK